MDFTYNPACKSPPPEPLKSPMYVLLSFHCQQENWQLYGSPLWCSVCWNESFRDFFSLCEGQQSMEAIWDIVNRQTASAHSILEEWKYDGDLPPTVSFLVVSPSIQQRAEVNGWELLFVILPPCWQRTAPGSASPQPRLPEHWIPLLPVSSASGESFLMHFL